MKILFAGGGTLGPVTPLLAVIEELRASRPEIECVFVGTPDGPERRLIEEAGIRFLALEAPKLRRYASLKTLALPLDFASAVLRAKRLLAAERPAAVVGAGGYNSVPLGLAAKLAKVRLVIHQQDVVPSLSNRLLAPFADAITVTFESSLLDFPRGKAELIGNPVRRAVETASRERGLAMIGAKGDLPVVLAVGGGTGSLFLNELILLGSPLWTGFCELVHVTGEGRMSTPNPPALTYPERYHRLEFAGAGFADLLAAADVVVSRAGLGTLTELAALAKPVVLVPIADSHQEANAEYVIDRGGGRMFRELDLTPEQLVTFTRELVRKPEDARRLGRQLQRLFRPGARAALTKRLLDVIST